MGEDCSFVTDFPFFVTGFFEWGSWVPPSRGALSPNSLVCVCVCVCVCLCLCVCQSCSLGLGFMDSVLGIGLRV